MNIGDRVIVHREPILSGDRIGARIGDIGIVRKFIPTTAVYIDFEEFNPRRLTNQGVSGHTWALQRADVKVIEPLNAPGAPHEREW